MHIRTTAILHKRGMIEKDGKEWVLTELGDNVNI